MIDIRPIMQIVYDGQYVVQTYFTHIYNTEKYIKLGNNKQNMQSGHATRARFQRTLRSITLSIFVISTSNLVEIFSTHEALRKYKKQKIDFFDLARCICPLKGVHTFVGSKNFAFFINLFNCT
jgi:hypothetical protein